LKSVEQHRTIAFAKNTRLDFHHEIRTHANDVAIEGSVMQLAERETIRHDWFTVGLPVGNDVSCIEEVGVAESTDRAAVVVCAKYSRSEQRLVQSIESQSGEVPAGDQSVFSAHIFQVRCIAETEGELVTSRIFFNEANGINGEIDPSIDTDEIGQGPSLSKRSS
jgi:hypothetical protein